MRARYGLAGLVLTALLVARPAASDPTGSYGYIVPFAGYTIFDGDLRFPNSHLTEGFKLSGDPQFIEKVRDVVGLYLDPPESAVVFSVGEKSQVQALSRSQPASR